MSEDDLHSMLSGCPVLESLFLNGIVGVGCLRISSPTIRSIGFRVRCTRDIVLQNPTLLQELVIENALSLQRLLHYHREIGLVTIRVMQAPILKILGILSPSISKLMLGTTVFQGMFAISLTTLMHTVKVLVLQSYGFNLDSVVDFLKCLPCVEKLYITSLMLKRMNNARSYNPLDPITCLELHLKKVVINNYCGSYNCDDKWMAFQHRRLQLDNKASPCALFTFEHHCPVRTISFLKADPFEWSGPREWQDELHY